MIRKYTPAIAGLRAAMAAMGMRGTMAVMAVMAVLAAGCQAQTADGAAQGDVTSAPTTQSPVSAPTGAAPTVEAQTTEAPTTDEAVEDGSYPAYIVTAEPGELTLDRIEILSGAEAAAARAEDGEPAVEDGVDIPYLRNRNSRLRSLPVADDVAVRVYDCSTGCELVEWTYADIVAGRPLPYGSPRTPFTVVVRDGQVVEIAEVYLA